MEILLKFVSVSKSLLGIVALVMMAIGIGLFIYGKVGKS